MGLLEFLIEVGNYASRFNGGQQEPHGLSVHFIRDRDHARAWVSIPGLGRVGWDTDLTPEDVLAQLHRLAKSKSGDVPEENLYAAFQRGGA